MVTEKEIQEYRDIFGTEYDGEERTPKYRKAVEMYMKLMRENKDFDNPTKKRFFLMLFICETCEKSHRLHKLETDFMGRLHCTHCKGKNFEIKKQFVTEDRFHNLSGKKRIIMQEITRVKYH